MDCQRRNVLKGLALAPMAHLCGLRHAAAGAPDSPEVRTRTAIQGVCAWPNLQVVQGGTLLAMIFNQPCHGLWEGDLDCWASEDRGRTWQFRSRVAGHTPGTNRMNCAAGVTARGTVVVLCGGWDDRRPRGMPVEPHRQPLRPWICRSADNGRSWEVSEGFPAPPASGIGTHNELIPFGNIRAGLDGSLRVAAYLRRDSSRFCYWLHSSDDGQTWARPLPLNPEGNETDSLHLGDGHWLAASRVFQKPRDVHLELLVSRDDGHTWTRRMPLTQPRQVTGHLARLVDGRVLLSYGNRCWNNYGVDVRLSDDEGATWSPPIRLAHCPRPDCGYPSTVQLEDGTAVTAYYTQVSDDFHYEMRTAHWDPSAFTRDGMARASGRRAFARSSGGRRWAGPPAADS